MRLTVYPINSIPGNGRNILYLAYSISGIQYIKPTLYLMILVVDFIWHTAYQAYIPCSSSKYFHRGTSLTWLRSPALGTGGFATGRLHK